MENNNIVFKGTKPNKYNSHTYLCPVCGGRGSIRLPNGHWGYCENCRGTGICKDE